jgi:hypothetical protein
MTLLQDMTDHERAFHSAVREDKTRKWDRVDKALDAVIISYNKWKISIARNKPKTFVYRQETTK